ncbi:uncharacterized protein LOC141891509 isoform X1 [Acropora palmata]|uniref:uncharacterized protein LOC141875582 isoform X1 n=1 Tax=Acropora palmata TaxID=6131 RepID=UPI003DA04DE8
MCSTCTAKVSVAALNRAPRNALNGITSLYLSDLEWSFLSMTTTCDRSANIHVACSTSLVTRGSCLSHSKLELHLTYCRSSSAREGVHGSISSHTWRNERFQPNGMSLGTQEH